MKTTFEHKYDVGNTVYIWFGPSVLEMKVDTLMYRKDNEGIGVAYFLKGNTTTLLAEDEVYATKEECLNNKR